jgi:eukaryotic-like serine/threonine-protein kinase
MTDATTAVTSHVELPDVVGSLIADKYRLEELIGEGGQAWIWRARHLELDSEVALKILRSATDDVTQIERLRKEARAVAKLNHSAIVRVFDLGQTPQGHSYFAMEHLEGENLADALTRAGRMDPIEAVRLLLPVASAVAAVHAIGVVHRDLKPDNVFLARSAHVVQPKLLDFGVAKHEVTKNRQMKLTEVGAVLGSPAYLSPEQARGQSDVDSRADVWSFCTMLYECVTGTVPFHASNTHALLFSIAEDEPLSLGDHGIAEEELWSIVRRGLEKSTLERWPNMRSLGRALAQWLSDRGVTSDITGVVLDSIWFNPDIVTPPPISPRLSETIGGDAPAWTKRTDAASHIESRAHVEATARPKKRSSPWLALTFLASMGASVGWLVGTEQGAHTMRRLPGVGRNIAHRFNFDAPKATAKSLKRFDALPNRLVFEQLTHKSAFLFPTSPSFLLPMPVVPVEKLRLVSTPVRRVAVAVSAQAVMSTAMSGTIAPSAAVAPPTSAAPKTDSGVDHRIAP